MTFVIKAWYYVYSYTCLYMALITHVIARHHTCTLKTTSFQCFNFNHINSPKDVVKFIYEKSETPISSQWWLQVHKFVLKLLNEYFTGNNYLLALTQYIMKHNCN